MKILTKALILLVTVFFVACKENDTQIRGWIILSDDMENAVTTIKAAGNYNINHLQLSHHIIHNLKDIRKDAVRKQVNELTGLAHREGIKEVLVWDHSFYDLSYYPDQFKTGPNGTLNLDDPLFWEWYKQDYREMLDLIPDVDGLILTFIETGAYAEKQYSERMLTNEEKLASVVNAIAEVVIEERKKKLYIRTFAYTEDEYANTIGCINHIKNKNVVLMMKETPHDFFLTHPDNAFIGSIDRPTIVEFDTGNEYNGQGVIANTWPEYVMKRWKNFLKRPNIVGYVARTDRYGTTKLIGTANEILLYALKRTTENPEITPDEIYEEFITARYGAEALTPLKNAFKKAYDIVSSSLYTLGTNTANHSAINYDSYASSYSRQVSGKWLDPPVVFVEHGVNMQFHYWKDVIDHIAPAKFKTQNSLMATEVKYVLDRHWVEPVEKMDSTYLSYIITEKQHGSHLALEALSNIEHAQAFLNDTDYKELYRLFRRTYLTAKLHEAVATAYFGSRVYGRGASYRYEGLEAQIISALKMIDTVTAEMESMKDTFPIGQWNWLKDAKTALRYKEKILSELPSDIKI